MGDAGSSELLLSRRCDDGQLNTASQSEVKGRTELSSDILAEYSVSMLHENISQIRYAIGSITSSVSAIKVFLSCTGRELSWRHH